MTSASSRLKVLEKENKILREKLEYEILDNCKKNIWFNDIIFIVFICWY